MQILYSITSFLWSHQMYKDIAKQISKEKHWWLSGLSQYKGDKLLVSQILICEAGKELGICRLSRQEIIFLI